MSFTPVNVIGLELPDAWRTGQVNDANFDISADQLNLTTNRQLWIASSTIDWGGVLHKNALDPVDLQDLATKIYVDNQGAAKWSEFVATQDVDMATNTLFNLSNPTQPTEPVTLDYLNNTFAISLQDLTDVENPLSPVNGDFLQFNSTSGEWEAGQIAPASPSSIADGNSSVSVVDSGTGIVTFTLDGNPISTVQGTGWDISVPVDMNNQKITFLGNPTAQTDAARLQDVTDAIALIPTELNDLDDVLTANPAPINEVLISNGTQFTNQLISKNTLGSLPIAYTDVTNTFSVIQQFPAGLQVGQNQNLDMDGGFISEVRDFTLLEQSTDPILTDITQATIFLDDAVTFGSDDPLLAVLINRGGTITKKPIVTSETVFALNQFSNGMFTLETGTELVDPLLADTMTVQIFNEVTRADSFDVVLEGEIFTIPSPDSELGTDNSRNLSTGTAIAPTKHYVWIELQLGVPVMTSNTTGFPQGQDFAVVGTFSLQDKASILTDGPYATNSPDYEIADADIRGHLAHINDRLIELDATYVSGIVLTPLPDLGGGLAAEVSFSSTEGRAFELHGEDIEAFDSTLATSILAVTNEGTQQPQEVFRVTNIGTDLLGLTLANGTTIYGTNGDKINVVLYTIHSDTEPNQTNYGINLPFDKYPNSSSDADAIADISGFAIRTVPNNVRGIVLLISELVIKFTTGPNFEIIGKTDLRGISPGVSGGGATGGGGATELNGLTDVTIGTIPTATGQILELQANSQWENVPNPAGLLAADNVWTGFQDYTEQLIPADPATTEVRLYSKQINGTNRGLFCKVEQDGGIVELQIA